MHEIMPTTVIPRRDWRAASIRSCTRCGVIGSRHPNLGQPLKNSEKATILAVTMDQGRDLVALRSVTEAVALMKRHGRVRFGNKRPCKRLMTAALSAYQRAAECYTPCNSARLISSRLLESESCTRAVRNRARSDWIGPASIGSVRAGARRLI